MAIDYKEKIKKLLALSESSNEHEAKAALLKARELMAEHKISMSDTTKTDKRIMEALIKDATYNSRKNPWMSKLAKVIATNNCCSRACYIPRGSRPRTIVFIGFPDDVKICTEIFLYALECIQSKEKEFRRSTKTYAEGSQLYTDYGMGFVKGLEEAYAEQNKEFGWGLVLSVPNEVTDYVNQNTSKKSIKSKTNKSSEAYASGVEDGKDFDKRKRIAE